MENELNERRDEVNSLETCIHELRSDYQAEKKIFNGLQAEQLRQKRAYEELKVKSKSCNRVMASVQDGVNRLEEMESEVHAKSEYIDELEGCVLEKNRELAAISQAFLK